MTDQAQSNLTEADQKLYDKIAKLLQLAANNPNAEEAASAAAMAQKLLVTYNLDASLIEKQQGRVDGKRENAAVEGGFYKFQRELYRAVADLNFCMYWTEEYHVKREKTGRRRNKYGEMRVYEAGTYKKKHRHRVIGRMINTATTKAMASYLEEAVERLVQDRLRKSNGQVDHTQILSNWAVSFRKGATENVIERIREQQAKDERSRKAAVAKAAREAAARGHASTATGLTLADVKKSEEAGNYDFLYGEGAWARAEQEAVEYAAARKRQREEYAAWAKANPEEAAKKEKEARKARRGGGGWGRSERDNTDYSAFNAGHEAGSKISLHRQAEAPKATTRIGGR